MEKGMYGQCLRSSSGTKLLQQAVLNKRRITLKKVLLQYMGLVLSREQPELHLDDIEYAGLGDELLAVSKSIGLKGSEIPVSADAVEMEFNGIAIALDGEIQFNEFRWRTLQSTVYNLPLIQELNRYKNYCQFTPLRWAESLSVKTKDRVSFEKGIIPSKSALQLQAIHDFMQDLLPLVHFVPVLRFSVYDQVETPAGPISLHQLLSEENSKNFRLLADHILRKWEDMEEVFCLEY